MSESPQVGPHIAAPTSESSSSENQDPLLPPPQLVEPWLRGTLKQVDALRRQVLHALELTEEDLQRWCEPLSDTELNTRPFGLPSVAFHIRHISRSLDRLLTYAEGHQLTPGQSTDLAAESHADANHANLFAEFQAAIKTARTRVQSVDPTFYEVRRGVGRALLPSTVGGLLIHCAEHTQRHTGQAITTAKLILARRSR